MDFITTVLLVFFFGSCSAKHVLFIMVDDMRPDISFLAGERSNMYSGMRTPHIDALAARSLVLKRAYVQQAVCGPSRTSLLTGRRPDTTKVHRNAELFREVGGNFSTIPEYFKDNGYISTGMGKIFHIDGTGKHDDLQSWSSDYTFYHPSQSETYVTGRNNSWKAVDTNDPGLENRDLADVLVARKANSTLEDFGAGGVHENERFFIAVGFHKPHLPFYFSKDYAITDKVELADNPYVPNGMPIMAWKRCNELLKYDDIKADGFTGDFNTSVSDTKAEELRKAYYGAIMWIDSLVGGVVQKVTDLGLENDTVIALMGDHGWHLGEHNFWCKHTNFEESTWAPLMFHIPGETDSGIVSSSIVEFIDIFPTIVEAAGLDSISSCPEHSSDVRTCTEGVSLVPLVSNSSAVLKEFAMSQNIRGGRDNDANQNMGYTIRTKNFRYTEWALFSNKTPNWESVEDNVELYDITNDPRENVNQAGNPAYGDIISDLQTKLRSAVNRCRDCGQGVNSSNVLFVSLLCLCLSLAASCFRVVI